MGTDAECIILSFGGLGVCYLLASRWRYHGAKSCIRQAETQANVSEELSSCLWHSDCCGELQLQRS